MREYKRITNVILKCKVKIKHSIIQVKFHLSEILVSKINKKFWGGGN